MRHPRHRRLGRGFGLFYGIGMLRIHSMAPVLALLVLGLAVAPAGARQGDDRLEGQFDRLLQSEEPPEIFAAERRIWQIWHESGSDTIDLLMGQGIGMMSRGDHNGALVKFDTIIELAPDFAEGWNKRATIYFLIGDYPASVNDIVKTLELEPRHFGALAGLGLIYDAIDKPEGALKAYRRALAIHPHLSHARERIKVLKKILKDRDI